MKPSGFYLTLEKKWKLLCGDEDFEFCFCDKPNRRVPGNGKIEARRVLQCKAATMHSNISEAETELFQCKMKEVYLADFDATAAQLSDA